MSKTVSAPLICEICKKPKSPHSGMIAELLRPSLFEFVRKKFPDLDNKAFVCFDDLGKFRKDYIREVLEDEIGELSALDHEVIESLHPAIRDSADPGRVTGRAWPQETVAPPSRDEILSV